MPSASRSSHVKRQLSYEKLEPRNLLAGDILVGNLNSGVAVSDDATGTGHIMYSETDVHTRFNGITTDNADHFIATRLDGLQWQYNNDINWIDFTPVESDLLVAEVDFDGDSVVRVGSNLIVEKIRVGGGEELRFVANRFGGLVDAGEFQVTGSSFYGGNGFADRTASEAKLWQISFATQKHESLLQKFPRAFNLGDDGTPLLSWRVHLLPFMGLESLYEQFNLDEPWNSPNNFPLASQMPDVYSSPHFSSPNETSFLAVTGSNTMFPAFGPKLGYSSITDGSHTTVMYVEADADQAVVWTSPFDLEFDLSNPLSGLGSASADSFAIVTASAETYTISSTTDPQNFANMAIRNDGNFVDFSDFAPYTDSGDSLRQLALSALNYESTYRKFPSHAIYSEDGTTPLLSWRVAILPFLEHQSLYDQFNLDEPWNSPHNLSLLPMMPRIFAHADVANGMTNYLGVSGPGTFFELAETDLNYKELFDGAHNTVMLVEADADQAVEWTKPQDWLVDPANPKAGLGGLLGDGFNVVFTNGATRTVDLAIDGANFGKMLTVDGGEVADFEQVGDWFSHPPNQLRELALGMLNFESAYMKLPKHGTYSDEGTPLLSWRVEILPSIGEQPLYDLFHHDEPWDSPHNLSLLPLMPEVFKTVDVANGFTVFQGANGPNTMLPLEDIDLSYYNATDGTPNTALIMQVDDDRAIEWTRPLDLPFDPSNPGDGLGGTHASGFYFATVEGGVEFYNNVLGDGNLEYLLQRNDGIPFGNEHVEDVPQFQSRYVIANKLRQLAISAHNYHSATRRLPAHAIYSPNSASGTPMLSWRVAILPYLEHNDLYDMFHQDEPWDSPHNLSLIPLMPEMFSHPMVENGKTVFQAITTPHDTGDPESMFTIHYRGSTLESASDGSSNTIMFVETNVDQAVEWTKPDDIMFDPNDPQFGLGDAYFGIGNQAALGDGSVHFIESCHTPEFYTSLILKNDGGDNTPVYTGCDDGTPATIAKSGIAYGNTEATDKKPLLPGETATFENYSSYIHGITKLSVDIGRLANAEDISAGDFIFKVGNGNNFSDFTTIGVTPTVTIDPGAGDNESDRVTFKFPDGSITNTWLQVTVKANAITGLTDPNVFYFGNAIGDTGNDTDNAQVNLLDVSLARANQSGFSSAGSDNPYDIDRDGRVDLIDVSLIRANQSGFSPLKLITAPNGSNRGADSGSTKSFSSKIDGNENGQQSLANFAIPFDVTVKEQKGEFDEESKRQVSFSTGPELRGAVEWLLETKFENVDSKPARDFIESVEFEFEGLDSDLETQVNPLAG